MCEFLLFGTFTYVTSKLLLFKGLLNFLFLDENPDTELKTEDWTDLN